MYRILAASMVVCLVLTGCGGDKKSSTSGGGDQANNAGGAGADVNHVALEGYTIGEPVRHANLTIYPVLSKEPRNDDRYITLDEGLANGTVEIVEVGASESMNDDDMDEEANPSGDSYDADDPFSEEDRLPSRRVEQTEGQTDFAPPQFVPNDDPFGEAPNQAPQPAAGDDPFGEEPNAAPQPAANDDPFGEAPDEAVNPPADDDPFGEAPNQSAVPQDADQVEGQPAIDQNDADQEAVLRLLSAFRDSAEPQATDPPSAYGNEVNTLVIVNRGEKPLYVMPGEVIIGGSQDRTIGREFIVQNDGQPMPIDVFCVEHGRWGGRDVDDTVNALVISSTREINDPAENEAATLEAREVAESVTRGKFVASVGQLSKDARLAVVKSGDQSEVWDTVSKENAKAGVNPDSGAFTANYTDEEAAKRLEEYIKNLKDPIAGQPQVVGVIVAINGRAETADVFESTPLFQKLWPKLLKSYALDAANSVEEDDALAECSRDKACDFLKEMMAVPGETVHQGQGIAVTRGEGENVFCTSVYPVGDLVIPIDGQPSSAAIEGAGGGGVGGFGGSVHASGFAH